jgi:hypothetical protein
MTPWQRGRRGDALPPHDGRRLAIDRPIVGDAIVAVVGYPAM